MLEWQDFGHSLNEHIYWNDSGVHIDQEGMHVIEDEADDIEHQYEMLEGSKWDKAYTAQWKKILASPESKSVGRRFDTFSKSGEWQLIEKELRDLDKALKTHVKISDLPEDQISMYET